jgi:2-C-methyl-D-erythritol 4-phosphate cytidylyltransferase/2-C-methyl-D-erythritol 2,4-cyclodiphosphate synthase
MESHLADAVIVAAGASRRMGGTDKLEADLGGRPLLAWAVEAMARARSVGQLIVVTAADRVDRLAGSDWLNEAAGDLPLVVVVGGSRRTDSVREGMARASADVVLVHDGARPLASPELVDRVAEAAMRHGAAIPVMPVADSLRRVDHGLVVGSVGRDGLAAAQTPQAARRELLAAAFAAAKPADEFTDEAELLAAAGTSVAAVAGEASNLKVTQPADLDLARALVASRLAPIEVRTGYGQDSHPFGPGEGLWLGGVLIEQAPRLHGHSDGDVALHALATALLSAGALGDLGRRFPPDSTAAGAASAGMLSAIVGELGADGWRTASAQVSLLGSRPRLGSQRLEEMRQRMAQLLGIEPSRMSVIASSNNLAGPEGAGLVISASALVSLASR